MDDNTINLERILEQAPKWTFAGDCTLLQWMKQISQDLENRANKTTVSLTKVDNNIRSTNIALDNVANSLTTLQFGNQFVECRVQEDDETVLNANVTSTTEDPQKTTTNIEILNTFLDNNLKVLRNCHEKYSIDLEDSDEEDATKEKTCIYQPINPYNDKPLPFIFGSKDWHSKWHVGLYENQQENSYSGDEISEVFSESASTSPSDDNESFESNTEWASGTSVDNDHLNANLEIKNASSLRESQAIINNSVKSKTTISESSSVSTESSALAKKSLKITKQNEILTQKSEDIYSSLAKTLSHNKTNTSQYNAQSEKFVDLFTEPTENLEPATTSAIVAPNIIRPTDDNRDISLDKPSTFRVQPAPIIDLFAEPPDDVPSSTISSLSTSHNIKRKIVNIFDEDINNMDADDLLSVSSKENKLEQPINKENNSLHQEKSMKGGKPSISTSLFDDSDEDDFIKAFVKKETSKRDLTKTSLFGHEVNEPNFDSYLFQTDKEIISSATKEQSSNKIQTIFDDIEGNEEDLLFKKIAKEDSKILIKNQSMNDDAQSVKISGPIKEKLKKSVNLFADDGDDDDDNDVPKIYNSNSEKMPKKLNLFDDLDDEDDLFSNKSKLKPDIAQRTSVSDIIIADESKKNVDKSVEILKDTTVTNDVNTATLAKNKFTNTNLQDNSPLPEDENKLKANVKRDEAINQAILSEIIENQLDTELSLNNDKLPAKEESTGSANNDNISQNQMALNKDSAPPTTQDKTFPILETLSQKSSSSKRYELNSILFLDEPPEDDNEFFESLSKPATTITSNYNAIDLENDIFEPDLPKVPASSSSNNNPTDISETFYTGIPLFSDIPPDDDDDDDDGGNSVRSKPTQDFNQTKRVHSVFYDDFSETLMALNHKPKEKDIPNRYVFSDEPPPMNKELNTISKDIIDHKEVKTNEDSLIIGTKPEETFYKSEDENTSTLSNKRPVSKLQMPRIDINVQALLPGASSNLRKIKEDDNKHLSAAVNSFDDIKREETITKGFVAKENDMATAKTKTTEELRSIETEHILPSITKNRVKASAARRPSTRRARQENYRKSLIEQQNMLQSGDENSESQTVKNNLGQTSSRQVEPNNIMRVEEQNIQHTINNKPSNVTTSSELVKENKTENLDVFNVKDADLEFKEKSYSTKEESPKNLEGFSLAKKLETQQTASLLLVRKEDNETTRNVKQMKRNDESLAKGDIKEKTYQDKKFLLFDDEEEDDDFFNQIKTSKTVDKEIFPKAKEYIEQRQSTNSFSETCKVNALNTPIVTANNINSANTKENPVSPLLDTDFSSTIFENLASTQECEKLQPVVNDSRSTNKSDMSVTLKITPTNEILRDKIQPISKDESDDDDFFNAAFQQPANSANNKGAINKAKSQFKSFLDSESDEEATVAGLQVREAKPLLKTSSTIITKNTIPMPSSTNTKLFSDSETDSDDLFGKSSSAKTPNILSTQIKEQAESYLFGAGKISKTTVPKTPLKEKETKSTAQITKSLFSDVESDEDDLFGGGAAKAATVNVTKTSNTKSTTSTSKPTASVAETFKSNTIEDNPLADLL